MVQLQTVLHDKIPQAVDICARITHIRKSIDQKTVAAGCRKGIHDIQFPLRKLFPQALCSDQGRTVSPGQTAGETDMQDVHALFQIILKKYCIITYRHLRGLR